MQEASFLILAGCGECGHAKTVDTTGGKKGLKETLKGL